MRGLRPSPEYWQIVVYGEGAALHGIPVEVFFDAEVAWHQQHFGIPGQVAYGTFVRAGPTLHALSYVSDVAQRISRRPDVRSRIENRFSGWPDVLVNAGLRLAHRLGCSSFLSPCASLVQRFTDPSRDVRPELFERVYDRTLSRGIGARLEGDWWVVELVDLADRLLSEHEVRSALPQRRRICVFHDIERGAGHRRVDPEFARHADEVSRRHLTTMLEHERARGVRSTYNVVGQLLDETRQEIERGGHTIAFHSFDHSKRKGQLPRCREVDYRIRGYRPPQSRLTRELTESNLAWYNFDWLAVAESELGESVPFLERGVAKIPILTDDYELYRQGTEFTNWAGKTLRAVEARDFAAIGLHDCYGDFWTPAYGGFLEELLSLGELVTIDDVANELFVSAAV